jgi:hypothetical protein
VSSIQHVPPEPLSPPAQSPIYHPLPVQRQSAGQNIVIALLLAIMFLVLTMAAGFLLLIASFTGWSGRTVGEAGERVGTAVGSAASAVGRAGQEARDRLDPAHPPREALWYDAEIEEFLKLSVGDSLPGGGVRTFTLTAIKSRPDGGPPELSRYVVVHSELRQPNENRFLGVTVRRDADPREHYLYQGEAFGLDGRVYKVNWISPERQQVALVQLRDPDRASLPLKFVYD